VIAYYVVGSIALIANLRARRSVVHLLFSGVRFRWPLFRDILRVGAVAALITIQTNLTIAIATGFVGRFGSAAIAGYGTGSRLEYLLIPLVFGLGGPLVAMVGTNIGAGQRDRALRAAWIGAGIAAGLTEIVGLSAAAFPHAWLSLFDTDPTMLDTGSRYLHAVGPSTVSSDLAWRSTSRRRARDGCCGHCSQTWCGLGLPPAVAGWRCTGAPTSRSSSRRSARRSRRSG